jgi:hypothetical protein
MALALASLYKRLFILYYCRRMLKVMAAGVGNLSTEEIIARIDRICKRIGKILEQE